jgi:hypothetical protein
MGIEADGSSMKLTPAGRRLLRTNSDHDECVEMCVYRLKTGERKKGRGRERGEEE